MKNIFVLIFLPLFLYSCASDYPCGEPRTGRCSSISENFQKSNQPIVNPEDQSINPYEKCNSGNCNASFSSNSSSSDSAWYSFSKTKDKPSVGRKYPQTPTNGSPLVSTPNMMRVWIAPYVDADNIYHDQGYAYTLVDRGHWLFGTNSVFGRGKSLKETTTKLSQDTNPTDISSTDTNTPAKPNITNPTNNQNTPVLNYLKQQDQTTISSLGIGK